MIKIPFLIVELALAVVWLLVRVCVWIKRRKIDKKQEAKLLLLFIIWKPGKCLTTKKNISEFGFKFRIHYKLSGK